MGGIIESVGSATVQQVTDQGGSAPSLDALTEGSVLSHMSNDRLALLNGDVMGIISNEHFTDVSKLYGLPESKASQPPSADEVWTQKFSAQEAPEATLGASSAEHSRTMDLLEDIITAQIKAKCAWSVVNGIGKDVKTMLHTQ